MVFSAAATSKSFSHPSVMENRELLSHWPSPNFRSKHYVEARIRELELLKKLRLVLDRAPRDVWMDDFEDDRELQILLGMIISSQTK